jgi:hypothetical protein
VSKKARSEAEPPQRIIEDALLALPHRDRPTGGIPYRHVIPAIAHQVMVMRRPHKQLAIRKSAAADLSKVINAAVRLRKLMVEHLRYDPKPSCKPRASVLLRAPETTSVNCLRAPLLRFIRAIQNAHRRKDGTSPKGAPLKGDPDAIAQFLYCEYERLTGETPKRTVRNGKSSGHFQTLIGKVFSALGIEASPEATTKRVMAKMKKKQGT